MKNNDGDSQKNNATWRILIASADTALADNFSVALHDSYSVYTVADGSSVRKTICIDAPDLVLIDPMLFPGNLSCNISEIVASTHTVRVIVIENQTDRLVDQYVLFKAGAHGFCKENISAALLNRAVQMVCEGEYWIQRKLIAKMINDLAREAAEIHPHTTGTDNTVIDSLTPRELEVARMVRLGGNNKMIARALDISERTVKAHLSSIFRKLDIQNRLHLALYFNEVD